MINNFHLKTLIVLLVLFFTATPAVAAVYTYDDLGRLSSVTYPFGQEVFYTCDAGGNLLSITSNVPIEPDVNNDGQVNVLDLVLIGQKWGQTGPPGWIKEDVNKDGAVNVLDMVIVGQHWTG